MDPDDGVLSLATFWRPRPHDPNPEMPGEKVSASISACPGALLHERAGVSPGVPRVAHTMVQPVAKAKR